MRVCVGGCILTDLCPPSPSSPSFLTTSSTVPPGYTPGAALADTHSDTRFLLPEHHQLPPKLVFVSESGVGWGQDTNRLTNEAGSQPASSPPPCRRLRCPSPSKSPPSGSPPRTRPRAPRAAPAGPRPGALGAGLRQRGAAGGRARGSGGPSPGGRDRGGGRPGGKREGRRRAGEPEPAGGGRPGEPRRERGLHGSAGRGQR